MTFCCRALLCCCLLFMGRAWGQEALNSDPNAVDGDYPPGMLELSIDSHGSRMNAILYTANGIGPHPTAVLLHGIPGNEKNLDLAQSLRRAGWNVLFFHYRGAWGSEGDFSFTHVIEDVGAALDYLQSPGAEQGRVDLRHVVLIGHSMGGFAALMNIGDPRVRCVVGLAPWDAVATFENAEAWKQMGAYIDGLLPLKGFSSDIATAELKRNGDKWNLARKIAQSPKPMLVINGEWDDLLLLRAPSQPQKQQQFIQLARADHGFSAARLAMQSTVLNWLSASCQ